MRESVDILPRWLGFLSTDSTSRFSHHRKQLSVFLIIRVVGGEHNHHRVLFPWWVGALVAFRDAGGEHNHQRVLLR